MRYVVLAASAALIAHTTFAQPPPGGPPRDTRPSTVTGTAVIKGRVFAGDTGRPLRRARITVTSPELGRDQRTTSTNQDGRYEVKELPAGRYTIRVGRSGYLQLQYGQRRPLEQGKPLQIIERQAVENIDFTLPRSSVITGRVMDETNEAIADVQVTAMRSMYFRGKRRLVPTGPPIRTDDAGEYRLIGLVPGSYYVMARLNETWTVSENGVEEMMGYAPTYFPGAMGMTDARRVTVGVGQLASNNNFSLIPGRAASVSGTVYDSTGRPIANRNVGLLSELSGPNMTMMMNAGNATTAGDGTFTIKNIPPGQYKLNAQAVRETATGPLLEVASQLLTLEGADVVNLSLTTSTGWSMAGNVTTENGAAPDAPPSRFSVVARLVDPDAGFGPGGAPPPPPPPGAGGSGAIPDSGRVRDDWTFGVAAVFGAARIRATVPDGWTVKAILQDGRDVSDTPIEMKGGDVLTGVTIIISNRLTSVSGRLADNKGAPLTDGTVIVFPDDASKWAEESRWIRAVRPDQQGRYEMKGLPAGEYLAVAVDYVEDGLWNDPEYLESLRRYGKRMSLTDAQTQILELKVQSSQF